MSNGRVGKRITLKRSRPNPIFEYWLRGLHEEAKEKKSKLEPMLKDALDSILRFPLPLESGTQCAVLKGFDKNLCRFLDIRLEAYYSSRNGSEVKVLSQRSKGSVKLSTSKEFRNGFNAHNPLMQSLRKFEANQRTTEPKNYIPKFRSGSYAILITLLEHYNHPPLEKQQLIDLAQRHCEESFSKPKPGSFYTAWSSMQTLIRKGFVLRARFEKTHYILSGTGLGLAVGLQEEYQDRPTINDMIFNGASTSTFNNPMRYLDNLTPCGSTNSSQDETPVLSQISSSDSVFIDMPADSFDVILLIDKNETNGCVVCFNILKFVLSICYFQLLKKLVLKPY